MMNIRWMAFLLVLSASPSLSARTWTDKTGRSMEAEIVAVDETQVTVNKGGKEFKLPLDNLSEEDRKFAKDWLDKQAEPEAKPDNGEPGQAAGGLTFDGKPFAVGGKTNLYEYLLKNDYKVTGAFLAGCNYDTSGEYQKIYRVPKAAYKNLKVFLGNPAGKADYAAPVAASLKKHGMSDVRSEVHQGGSSLDYGQFAAALKWFAE